MEEKKVIKWGDAPPPFFLFPSSLFKPTEIFLRATKMRIFYREKAFHARKKIRKNDFSPSEKYSSYAPGGVFNCY